MKTQNLVWALLWPLAGWAQAPVQTLPSPALLTVFYTADFQRSTAEDTTAYCAELILRDSARGSGAMRVYYPSGHLRQYVPYSNVYERRRYGTLTTWYEDGQLRTKEDFVNDVRHGDLLTYYPDGTLKRREQYDKGHCGIGNCYDPDGSPVPYFVYEQLPLYPGGPEQLLKEVGRALRLTTAEREAMLRESHRNWLNPQRQIDVELTVGADGRVTGARVVNSTASFLNDAALRAVAKLQRVFVPGRRDGQTLTSYLTVPVYYTLAMPYQPSGNYSPVSSGRLFRR